MKRLNGDMDIAGLTFHSKSAMPGLSQLYQTLSGRNRRHVFMMTSKEYLIGWKPTVAITDETSEILQPGLKEVNQNGGTKEV